VQLAWWQCPLTASTRAAARDFNVNFSTISRLQTSFREFGSTFNRPHNRPRVNTPSQDLHELEEALSFNDPDEKDILLSRGKEDADLPAFWEFVGKRVNSYCQFYLLTCNHCKIKLITYDYDYPTNGTEKLWLVRVRVRVCVFNVNNSWCAMSKIKEVSQYCSPEVEYLMISCRPHYLPREFSSILFLAIYLPPHTEAGTKTTLNQF
jgi:hypothetical protein